VALVCALHVRSVVKRSIEVSYERVSCGNDLPGPVKRSGAWCQWWFKNSTPRRPARRHTGTSGPREVQDADVGRICWIGRRYNRDRLVGIQAVARCEFRCEFRAIPVVFPLPCHDTDAQNIA
jgi:hypothetical protein